MRGTQEALTRGDGGLVTTGRRAWLYPLLRRVAPGYVTTTDHLGRAVIAVVALQGGSPTVLSSRDINRLGAPAPTGTAPMR